MLHALHPARSRAVVAVVFAIWLAVAPVAPSFAHPTNAGQSSAVTTTRAQHAVDAALDQLGTRYRWGGNTPRGFDCSGLTSWAYAEAGVTIPRTSRARYSQLTRVSRSNLLPGDLVFYNSPVSHVAMYVGDGQIVESPRRGLTVRLRSLDSRTPRGYARP
jgi:cell wall-associated NlpC family hydrolase